MPPTGAFVMERRPGTDAPRAVPALPAPVSAALALGFALALGAGEAAAQNLCAGDVVTGRTSIVVCDRAAGETRDVHIDLRDPDIALTGFNESPVTADTYGVGSVTIEVTGGSLSSSGNWAKGIRSWSNGGSGDVAVTVKDVDITTANDNGNAVYVRRQAGTGNIRIDVSGGVLTTTGGGVSQGITGWLQVAGDIDIDAKDVVMRTEGANSLGIFGYQQGPTGDVDVAVQGGSIETNGFLAHGVYSGKIGGTGNADLSVSGASVTTKGRFTRAVNGVSSGEGDVTVDVSGEAVIVAEGEGSVGVYLLHVGNGSGHATIGAETRTAAPFASGVYGRLMPSANAAGRIVIDARGRIEARNAGILAWAEPRSGSTFGEGNEAADETAGTAPMIHVTSSGDVTVGEGVMDAYIRAAAAGDDETLSAGEQTVLDAITAGDEDALTAALDALPDDYDDAWKARMRAFRAARGAERTDHHGSQGNAPGANARLAEQAAVEILDLPRAGIRAMALSHTEIADHVRRGGLGGTLSDDERTVLAAVLTGGDVEAALAALPADYTDTWKDGVRLRAMSYNTGDVRVDVTGGAIASEGDGVHARYVVTHDRNGAITVSVAEGASVTGGRHGIYAGGAGLDDDGLRAHTMTVNGVVMGGTGAGVHLVDGGTVTVGETGRVGATSGDGILSDGPDDLSVTVAGTVEGDVRARGGGDLTLDVREGGAVTGTVHDPAGPLTVHGSIGRLLYTRGGTVTVAATGRLTGVEGESDAVRSEAGDLAVTVAGTVAGDLRAPTGGALTLDVREGGAVTGTVHDPAGPLTVHGSIGRLLYTRGGTVTVAATGRLTGVEGESDAVRSEAGDLAVTVAGTVAGDLRAPTGGALTLDVREGGAVTGTVHDPAGPLTVAGHIGRLLYTRGGTVTVAATGRLTGVEGESDAVRSEAGDLAVTVAGTVAGDLRALGGGDLDATISGTVEGDVRASGGGDLTLDVREGGAVTGTVHDPAGPLTVRGSIGRLLYTNGGRVTVAATGRLSGVEVEGRREAVRGEAGDLAVTVAETGRVSGDVRGMGEGSLRALVAGTLVGDVVEEGAGDLTATVSGRVEGDVFGRGTGEHTVTVAGGGVVTGTIHLSASTVGVDGTAGQVRFDRGGVATVGKGGRLTGVEGVAVRNEAGALVLSVAGRVEGDVIDRGARPAKVTTELGSTVGGDIDVAGADSEVRVGGTAEGVRFRRGGTMTVGPAGTVRGSVSSERGELVAEAEQGEGETAAEALERAFRGEVAEEGGTPTLRTRKEGEPARTVGAPGTAASAPDGAWDVGVESTPGGGVRVVRALAPRSRVYEALPSVLLGLNTPTRYGERRAAGRSAKGGWARVEASRGHWKADGSASREESGVGLAYRHRRHGVQVGLSGAWGEGARVGASLHHRRGSATVEQGGEVALYGTGAGVSGTWSRGEAYLDVQAELTWYEADLTSSSRGVLGKEVSGQGHALGVEAGRRLALSGLPELVLTPRAGLVHSQVDVRGFTDATGSRVRVRDARAFLGRVGVEAEARHGGSPQSRVYGTVDLEHEFETARAAEVSGRRLRSEADATWLRLGLNGEHASEDGGWSFAGGMHYATTSGGGYALGGGLSLGLRF